MVIRDANPPLRAPEKSSSLSLAGENWAQRLGEQVGLASPADRLAANVIDYFILLWPIVALAVAPFQRSLREGALMSSQWQMSYSLLFGAMTVVLLLLSYQTFCVWLWGMTVGKRLMGLRVQNIFINEPIRFFQALVRSFFWATSWLMLGVPFFAAFSHDLRRSLHDRISDTIVVTTRRERFVTRPSLNEKAMVKGVYSAFGAFCAVIFSVVTISTLAESLRDDKHTAGYESENFLCPEVGEAQSDWPKENGVEATRLSVAMSLFAAGVVERKCLQNEVEFLFLAGEESALVYLAKSFVYSDQPELSEKYLEKVCALDDNSHECRLSDIVRDISVEDWPAATKKFQENADNAPVYVLVWGTRQFLDREEFSLAEQFASRIPDLKVLSDFVVPAQAKSLWGLHKINEAKGLETAAYSTLSDSAKLDLSSFMCVEELWLGCEHLKNRSCQNVEGLLSRVEDGLATLKTSLAYLHKWECEAEQGEHKKDYATLMSLPFHPDVRSLVSILSENKVDDMSDLLRDESLGEELLSDISQRMVLRMSTIEPMRLLTQDWLKGRETLGWAKTGEVLFKKYVDLKEYQEGLKVVKELERRMPVLPPKILQQAFVTAMKSGEEKVARHWLSVYSQAHPLPELLRGERYTRSHRAPASTASDEFVENLKRLKRRGL